MRSKDLILPGLLVLLVAAVAWAFLAQPPSPDDTFDAPDLGIRTGNKIVSLKQYRGKVVLVDFWATWCGPCRMSIPTIEGLYREYHPRGLEVMGAAVDDDSTAGHLPAFIKEMGMTYPTGRLTDPRVQIAYRAESIPFMVLVDRKGKGRLVQRGYSDAVEAKLAAKIESLLKEPAE